MEDHYKTRMLSESSWTSPNRFYIIESTEYTLTKEDKQAYIKQRKKEILLTILKWLIIITVILPTTFLFWTWLILIQLNQEGAIIGSITGALIAVTWFLSVYIMDALFERF